MEAQQHESEDPAMRDTEGNQGEINERIELSYTSYLGTDARTVFRGDNETMNSAQSLYTSDISYINLHGRRYCQEYYMPNDEEEQSRAQMLHGVYLYLFDQKLTTVPLRNPLKILDIGTGTGEWAMAMGDEYPEAEVIGTDIAKIQPSAVPLNVYFEIDDAEAEGGWTWAEDEFDLVHFRSMQGAFKDWEYIYSEAYRHLKPGGWIEVIDFDDNRKMMSYLDEESEAARLSAALGRAAQLSDRPRSITHVDPAKLASLGFVDVSVNVTMIPIGSWPDEPEQQQVAKHFLAALLLGMEALCLRLLTQVLGWDPVEVRRVCDAAIKDVRTIALDPVKSRGMGSNVKVLVGRKPFPRGFSSS